MLMFIRWFIAGQQDLLYLYLIFYILIFAVYMCDWENRERVRQQLASYKLLESEILANCSNRAAAAAEDTGRSTS